jgi:hypothetical protein
MSSQGTPFAAHFHSRATSTHAAGASRRDDLKSNALLLMHHTGMLIGELFDLSRLSASYSAGSVGCPRAVGRTETERLVPVDSLVCPLLDRLRSLRSVHAGSNTGACYCPILAANTVLIRKIRVTLQDVLQIALTGSGEDNIGLES